MLKPWKRAAVLASTALVLLVAGRAVQAEEPSKSVMDEIGPTDPETAKLLGPHRQKGMFHLLTDETAEVASLPRSKRFRVCILPGSETAKVVFETSYLVIEKTMIVTPTTAYAAKEQKIVNDEKAVLIAAAHCADVKGQRIKVMPVSALGGKERIRGTYEPVN
ncbi:MAG: hypothetical protein OEM93_04625 [Rhodospirillales bacterium]|nr:hypothetical protein [Rhodospirillales bacterium]MDH3790671.1 hypothetical protein [Rhodospirillales bacterium]MDH3918945.1 hypothetical protein [Rhodospirillales bacterium]MDH3969194.1 hypothetical protein [Rhodospirillales bacterium]